MIRTLAALAAGLFAIAAEAAEAPFLGGSSTSASRRAIEAGRSSPS